MKAAVQKAVNLVEVEEVPEPVAQPDQIKVKIAYAGICGTDMEILEGTFGLVKHPVFPKIEGHEASPGGTRWTRRLGGGLPRGRGGSRQSLRYV